VFCNERWDLVFEQPGLQALATALSDKCPLMLSSLAGPRRPRPFCFENFWTKILGFLDEVHTVWQKPSPHSQPIRILHHKLSCTARHLRKWSQSILSDAKKKLFMALEVIKRLDIAQESMALSDAVLTLRRGLKRRVVGLSVVERASKKQASRITNLKEGDANKKFFHQKVNARHKEKQHTTPATSGGMGHHT